MAVSRVAESLFGRDPEGVVRAGEAAMPGQAEIEVVARAPRDGFGGTVLEFQDEPKEESSEKTIRDRELIFERVGFAGRVAGLQDGGEASVVSTGKGEFPIAGKAVHRHGAAGAIRGSPKAEFGLGQKCGQRRGKGVGLPPLILAGLERSVLSGQWRTGRGGAPATVILPVHQARADLRPGAEG